MYKRQVLAVLGVSLNLYQSGKMGVEGVLVCTLSALSSFGPVVALAKRSARMVMPGNSFAYSFLAFACARTPEIDVYKRQFTGCYLFLYIS